jgi:hypothetical protein
MLLIQELMFHYFETKLNPKLAEYSLIEAIFEYDVAIPPKNVFTSSDALVTYLTKPKSHAFTAQQVALRTFKQVDILMRRLTGDLTRANCIVLEQHLFPLLISIAHDSGKQPWEVYERMFGNFTDKVMSLRSHYVMLGSVRHHQKDMDRIITTITEKYYMSDSSDELFPVAVSDLIPALAPVPLDPIRGTHLIHHAIKGTTYHPLPCRHNCVRGDWHYQFMTVCNTSRSVVYHFIHSTEDVYLMQMFGIGPHEVFHKLVNLTPNPRFSHKHSLKVIKYSRFMNVKHYLDHAAVASHAMNLLIHPLTDNQMVNEVISAIIWSVDHLKPWGCKRDDLYCDMKSFKISVQKILPMIQKNLASGHAVDKKFLYGYIERYLEYCCW